MKTALITACSGQDGSFMAEHLLSLGYRVVGTIRKNPASVPWLKGILDKMDFVYADIRDEASIESAVNKAWPDEVYNFAGYDGIPLSWHHPEHAMDVIYGGLSRLLKVLRNTKADARVYQASSASIFGNVEGKCSERTMRNPVDPYGIAKNAAHDLAILYREQGMHISCGICMNHESERRYNDRVSVKIARHVAGWSLGGEEPLLLGNMTGKRDWGFSGDFVKAFHLMLQQEKPGDYVIGTGQAHSVWDFLKACCTAIGFAAVPENLLKTDERMMRKNDIRILVANPEKIEIALGWKAETSFRTLAERMVSIEVDRLKKTDVSLGATA